MLRSSRKPPAGQGQTIVLAEDDDSVRDVVREILEKNGYSVISFGDPIECVTEMERRDGSLDLLLTDVVMPRMNGRRLFERLARKFPRLPVIYMSGFDQGIITDRGWRIALICAVLVGGIFVSNFFYTREVREQIVTLTREMKEAVAPPEGARGEDEAETAPEGSDD